jgi:hypothetical protein
MIVLKRFILATSMGLATLLVPATSQASTIPFDCDKCGNHNTAFDITYTVINPALNTYALTVTATYQPDGAGAMDYVYINAISMKFEGLTFQNGTPSLISGPDGGPWTVIAGGLDASGCTGTGGGFFCANSAGDGAAHSGAGDTDTWVFLLDLTAPLGATQTVHFKGHFVDANGNKVGDLISDNFTATPPGEVDPNCTTACTPTAVPEPASLLLMGAGLSLVAARLRRKSA